MNGLLLAGFALLISQPLFSQTAAGYLPLQVGNKWVLRNARQRKPVVFEVMQRDQNGALIQSITPWGSSRFTLSEDGGKFFMTAYGAGTSGRMMPLPDSPLYLDFARTAGDKWTNGLGALTMISGFVMVRSQNQTYTECMQLEHQANKTKLWSTFARGVGYVQFGQDNNAFVLDESASTLPARGGVVPQPLNPQQRLRERNQEHPQPVPNSGLTPNRFAKEPLTEAVMKARLQQTVAAGVSYVSGTAKWAELETAPKKYSLEAIQYFLEAASGSNLPVSYTLRIIDTVARDVPSDLRNTDWSDSRMRDRGFALADMVAPLFKDRVRWLSLGYEVDSYLQKHPAEAEHFTEFFAALKARFRKLLPSVEISSTATFSGIAAFRDQLRGLNDELDFLSLTYCPLNADFTVRDPAGVPGDFAQMKQVAGTRKIVLQEIGYPTAPATGGSEEKQAEFYRLSFREINRQPEKFAAVNFMNLADLSAGSARQFADFYSYHTPAFEGVLQTMGLFNQQGEAKEAWSVFQNALKGALP